MADINIPNAFAFEQVIPSDGVNDNFDEIESKFNASIASILNDSGYTAGAVALANGAGIPAFTAISGDGTLSGTGVFTIGDSKVKSRQAGLTTGKASATSDLTLTTSLQDVAGATVTFTPAVASYAIVWGVMEFLCQETSSGNVELYGEGVLDVDGVDNNDKITALYSVDATGTALESVFKVTAAQTWRVSLTAASHTLKLQARDTIVGAGDQSVAAANTSLTYLLVAQ